MQNNFFKNEDQNAALTHLLDLLEKTNEFSACYLTGSYSEGYAVDPYVSDIDLTIISRGPLKAQTRADIDSLITRTKSSHGIDLDISIIENADKTNTPGSVKLSYLGIAFREAALSAKLSGKLIWGDDVLSALPLPSPQEYLNATEEIPFEFSDRIRGYKGLQYPLNFPDENDPFYGYLRMDKAADHAPDNQAHANHDIYGTASTKPLISLLTWLGTATAAQLSPATMVGNKNQCIKALSAVDPEKGKELSYIFDKCRREWGYKVPKTPEGRAELQSICARALEWENEYRNKFFPQMKDYRP